MREVAIENIGITPRFCQGVAINVAKPESTVIYRHPAFAQFFYILRQHWKSQYQHGEGRLFTHIEDVA